MEKYITKNGDTWDLIAYNVLGSEFYCALLMQLNFDKLDYLVFPDNVELCIPSAEDVAERRQVNSDIPDWRGVLNG